ncbi:MAG: hypothetical protein K940chlam1_01119 [Candidatus Anoxychlamydiales bacterium]|nr:hypothetical protein [Candidatus Anoxychlamydiales bacterium]NGX35437.1 hypothetical protein [Candidatus Anoxychlamydiales bacterium]
MNEVLYKKNVIVKTFFLGIFLALAICTPLFLKNKFVISTIINFILLLSVASIGMSRSIIVCIVPSIVAISVGMLPSMLLPFIPLIMLSNILLVVIFNAFQKYSHFFALFLAALIKCSFLYSLGWGAKNLFPNSSYLKPIVVIVNTHQIIGAFSAAAIVFVIITLLKLKSKTNG